MWYPTRFFARPLDRMVSEAVQIKDALERSRGSKEHIVLNSKVEFNRCILPGITQKPTDKDKENDNKIKEMVQEVASLYKRQKPQEPPGTHPQCGNRYEGRPSDLPPPVNAQVLQGVLEACSDTEVSLSNNSISTTTNAAPPLCPTDEPEEPDEPEDTTVEPG